MGMTQIKCKCPGELCRPCNGSCTLTQLLLRHVCPVPVVDRELCRSAVEPACLGMGCLSPLDPCVGEIGTMAGVPENLVCQASLPWMLVGEDMGLHLLGARLPAAIQASHPVAGPWAQGRRGWTLILRPKPAVPLLVVPWVRDAGGESVWALLRFAL